MNMTDYTDLYATHMDKKYQKNMLFPTLTYKSQRKKEVKKTQQNCTNSPTVITINDLSQQPSPWHQYYYKYKVHVTGVWNHGSLAGAKK